MAKTCLFKPGMSGELINNFSLDKVKRPTPQTRYGQIQCSIHLNRRLKKEHLHCKIAAGNIMWEHAREPLNEDEVGIVEETGD